MRIVRSKGVSFTEVGNTDKLSRGIKITERHGKANQSIGGTHLAEYLKSDPDLIIRQFISVIDKIVKKPKTLNKMLVDWFDLRDQLGHTCWEERVEPMLLRLGTTNDAVQKLSLTWAWKLHPYVENTTERARTTVSNAEKKQRKRAEKNPDKKFPPDYRGRWFARFIDDEENIDFSELAREIENHLFKSQMSIQDKVGGKHGRGKGEKGLIENRAASIQQSTYEKSGLIAELNQMIEWGNEESDLYGKPDVAAEIKEEALSCEANYHKLTTKVVGKVLYDHFASIGLTERGRYDDQLRGRLVALHRSVKQFYREKIHNSNRGATSTTKLTDGSTLRPFSTTLPSNIDELITTISYQRKNRLMNDLIRHGRNCYFSNLTTTHDAATPSQLSQDEKESYFWTSDGQAQIKRDEAFSRVWRNVISQAARTAKSIADPSGLQFVPAKARDGSTYDDDDVLMSGMIKRVTEEEFDREAYANNLDLIFGNQAQYFRSCDSQAEQNTLLAMLRITSKIRTAAFHFSDRTSFTNALANSISFLIVSKEQAKAPIAQETQDRFVAFYKNDQKEQLNNLRLELEGALVPAFANADQIDRLIKAVAPSQNTNQNTGGEAELSRDLPLPKFNRLLDRLDGTKQAAAENDCVYDDARQYLPPRANSLELTEPFALCKFTAMKMVYETEFREWVAVQPEAVLQSAMDQVVNEGTERAKASQDQASPYLELIEGKGSQVPPIRSGGLLVLFDDLAQIVATELRHQNGYEPEPEGARKKSKWIEDFKCDLLALLYTGFLEQAGHSWLLSLNAKSTAQPFDKKTWFPKPDEQSVSDEPWEANLYTFLHLVPVDDVARLRHQFRKTAVLETKSERTGVSGFTARHVTKILDLHMSMHNAKFTGEAINIGLSQFEEIFQDPKDFKAIYGDEEDQTTMQTRRGLRQVLRFGHLNAVKEIYAQQPVSHSDVQFVFGLEQKSDGKSTRIQRYQREKQILHRHLVKSEKPVAQIELNLYNSLRDVVETHKHKAAQVRLTDHARLHQVLMRVIARLIDYAGIWERDALFVFLALIKQQRSRGETGRDVVPNNFPRGKDLKTRDVTPWLNWLTDENRVFFNTHFGPDKSKIRNDLAHFNILADQNLPVDLTHQINRVRDLMSYDRKLKNAVSKSIKELLEREGVIINWTMQDHQLSKPKITSKQFAHLSGVKIEGIDKKNAPVLNEQAHSDAFLAMIASIFHVDVPTKTRIYQENRAQKIHDKSSENATPDNAGKDTNASMSGSQLSGTVKWFNTTKGFGFIAPTDGSTDVFVHISKVEQSGLTTLTKGQSVQFSVQTGKDGRLQAKEIHEN